MEKLKTASVLSFARSLDISDAIFFQKNADKQTESTPVEIREKSVRGTISNRLSSKIAKDEDKVDAKVDKANLQTVDVASLDHDKDTLMVQWSCKVLPFSVEPNVCNSISYKEKLATTLSTYVTEHQFTELSKRYAANILNGRWLWRNRFNAGTVKITIEVNLDETNEQITISDAKAYSLANFKYDDNIEKLAAIIQKGLLGHTFVVINVTAELEMGLGQEVYPSQELILDTVNTKSKVLYRIKGTQAGIHSQKIGNAIRTIDDWYAKAEFPIAVETYGSVTNLGVAFRQPKNKEDFYSLFDDWVLKDVAPKECQQHYVIATLMRGGVFGASSKE